MDARAIAICLSASSLLACGKQTHESAEQPAAEPAPPAAQAQPAEHPDHAHPAAAEPQAAPAPLPPVPETARVFFREPADAAKIEGPLENGKVAVQIKMGAEGIAIKPAGAIEAGSGHHHVLIDTEDVAAGEVVPSDEQHVHFGTGQVEATLPLAPGSHELTLQLADGIHRSYGPQLASRVRVEVVARGTTQAQAATEK